MNDQGNMAGEAADENKGWEPPTEEEIAAGEKENRKWMISTIRARMLRLNHTTVDVDQIASIYWGAATCRVTLRSGHNFNVVEKLDYDTLKEIFDPKGETN
jgi:hypothetical protein